LRAKNIIGWSLGDDGRRAYLSLLLDDKTNVRLPLSLSVAVQLIAALAKYAVRRR
jgi:hypothetical protein